jgi:hypothetical protein
MARFSKSVLVLMAGVGVLSFGSDARATVYTYDFDNGQVTGSASPGTPLLGQDGWGGLGHNGDVGVRNDVAAIGMPGNAAFNTLNGNAILGRKNDANFSYSIPAGASNMTLEFLGRIDGGNTNVIFGLGYDADNNGAIDVQATEAGFHYGYADQGFYIRQPGFGSDLYSSEGPDDADAGEVWRMVLDVDLTANGGDGAGSLSVAQIWDGSTLDVNAPLVPVADMQNINLGITGLGVPISQWDGIMIRTSGRAGIALDNLTVDVVPEPTAVVLLLGAALVLLGVRRR